MPFTLGIDFAGVVRSAPAAGAFSAGDRVAGWRSVGADAEVLIADPANLFALPDEMTFVQGVCLPLNYLTAHFALITRGSLTGGETVLVHGAAGGVGTAVVQLAKAYGATVIAVVSTDAKRVVAEDLGADHVVLTEGFRDSVRALDGVGGVDLVVDLVGRTDLVLDSLRLLNTAGRLLVVGFAGGEIPSVQLNRLLLNNVELRGVAWGPYTRANPGFVQWQWEQLTALMRSGVIAPKVGAVYRMEDVRQALLDLSERRMTGKGVLQVR
jgi:NADPH2:quinone reductase